MLSKLVTSKTRRELITLFLTHPEERFYYAQLMRDHSFSSAWLQKELKELVATGFLESEQEPKVKYYKVNKSFPLYNELKSIIYKTIGLADALKESLSEVEDIKVAFIYGSVAKNLENVSSDIDVMVIGEISTDMIHDAFSSTESNLLREINYSVYSPADWKKALKEKKAFVRDVAKGKKIFLIGSEDELRRLS